MQRLAALEHDVVRHVDDVGDRPHADHGEPGLHPRRRRRDVYAVYDASRVARAEVRGVDVDADRGSRRRILLVQG